MKILTTDLIRKSEESAVGSGAFSLRDLMFRAGSAAAELIMQKYDFRGKKITVVCGRGNNGGDGCEIAGILAENGGVNGADLSETGENLYRAQFVKTALNKILI